MDRVPRLDYRVIIELLEAFNCARSLTVAILFRYEEYEQIVNLAFNPSSYNNCEDARMALYATELLRKHESLPTNIDKQSVAFAAFEANEQACKQTNDRLLERNAREPIKLIASRKIADVLGEFDPVEFLNFAGWGPGSTLRIRRRDSSPSNKFRCEAELTQPLYNLLKPWFRDQFPNWFADFRVYEGNKVITVPKNAKTDRTIAVEPSLNLYFQKGIGTMIRTRLHRFGVHLDSQIPNQEAARIGSIDNSLATVDFSAASDTISSILVLDLLPFKWYQVLDCLRSSRGLYKDSLIEYEKFSSMGNGFTFELESLIFWSIAKSIVPSDHTLYNSIIVFGDDVIIPSEYVEEYRDVCRDLGFTLNESKTFSSTYYRESCGKHFWHGVDITPIYLRHFLKDVEVLKFHNRVTELLLRSIGSGFRDKRFRSVQSLLRDSSLIKCPVPLGYGDIGLITSFDEATPTFCREYQRGFVSKAYVPRPRGVEEDDAALLLSKVYSLMKQESKVDIDDSPPSGNRVIYSSRASYRFKRLWFADWSGLGPWL
jgi:hypothetical protein